MARSKGGPRVPTQHARYTNGEDILTRTLVTLLYKRYTNARVARNLSGVSHSGVIFLVCTRAPQQ